MSPPSSFRRWQMQKDGCRCERDSIGCDVQRVWRLHLLYSQCTTSVRLMIGLMTTGLQTRRNPYYDIIECVSAASSFAYAPYRSIFIISFPAAVQLLPAVSSAASEWLARGRVSGGGPGPHFGCVLVGDGARCSAASQQADGRWVGPEFTVLSRPRRPIAKCGQAADRWVPVGYVGSYVPSLR
jgi:hypothetical protein